MDQRTASVTFTNGPHEVTTTSTAYITAALVLIGGIVGFALLKHAGDHADDATPESIKHPAGAAGEG